MVRDLSFFPETISPVSTRLVYKASPSQGGETRARENVAGIARAKSGRSATHLKHTSIFTTQSNNTSDQKEDDIRHIDENYPIASGSGNIVLLYSIS